MELSSLVIWRRCLVHCYYCYYCHWLLLVTWASFPPTRALFTPFITQLLILYRMYIGCWYQSRAGCWTWGEQRLLTNWLIFDLVRVTRERGSWFDWCVGILFWVLCFGLFLLFWLHKGHDLPAGKYRRISCISCIFYFILVSFFAR